MMKTLGQNGLNFIANKYKELRTALSKKVDEIDGKSLSTNDYDNTAKSKVDAIPSNPKYTDTTYDLSKYAEKSDISRCKTKGYDTSSTWQALGTTRDLEDWIGDFDKRTRELKSGVSSNDTEVLTFGKQNRCYAAKRGKIVFLFVAGNDVPDNNFLTTLPSRFLPSKYLFEPMKLITSTNTKMLGWNVGNDYMILIESNGNVSLGSAGNSHTMTTPLGTAMGVMYFTD